MKSRHPRRSAIGSLVEMSGYLVLTMLFLLVTMAIGMKRSSDPSSVTDQMVRMAFYSVILAIITSYCAYRSLSAYWHNKDE